MIMGFLFFLTMSFHSSILYHSLNFIMYLFSNRFQNYENLTVETLVCFSLALLKASSKLLDPVGVGCFGL